MNITPEHWLFIPSVFILGWVVGFLMGQAKQPPNDQADKLPPESSV